LVVLDVTGILEQQVRRPLQGLRSDHDLLAGGHILVQLLELGGVGGIEKHIALGDRQRGVAGDGNAGGTGNPVQSIELVAKLALGRSERVLRAVRLRVSHGARADCDECNEKCDNSLHGKTLAVERMYYYSENDVGKAEYAG